LSGAAVPQDTYKSRLLADLNLGDNPALTVEYYRAIGGSAYSVAPGFSLERTHFSVYNGDDRTDLQRKRFAGSLYMGMGTGRQVQLRIGATGGLDRYGGPRFLGPVQADDSAFVNTEVTGIINTQDSGQLPTRGLRVNGSAGYSFRKHSFPYLDMNFDHFHPVSKQFSIFEMGQLGTSFGRPLTLFDQFAAGGLTEMDAFRYQELRANTLLALGGGAIYRGFRPMFGAWYEAAGLEPFESASEFKQSATLGAFLPTPLGLTGLTFSSDLHRSFRVRVSLGSFWNRP
jgi:outer membrane protein assembly factor BamA